MLAAAACVAYGAGKAEPAGQAEAAAKADAAARRALGARALTTLRSALTDPEGDVRALAAEAFGRIGIRAGAPLLTRALEDKDHNVQIAAAESLARLGEPSGFVALERLGSEKVLPKPKGGALGAVEELRAIARGKARAAAIRALVRLNSAGSLKVFRRARRDKMGLVRDAGAAALARLGDGEQLAGFLAALKDPDEAARLAAARSLGEVATPVTVEPLAAAADDPSPEVRAAVMTSLGEAGTPAVLGPLKAGLQDKSDLVRGKALEALARRPQAGAGSALEAERARPGNVYLQLLASEGLARLGRPVELGPVMRSLSQKDVDTRLAAVRVLEVSKDEAVPELLASALEDADPRVRVAAAAALVKKLARPAPEAPLPRAGERVSPPAAAGGDQDAVPEAPPEAAQ